MSGHKGQDTGVPSGTCVIVGCGRKALYRLDHYSRTDRTKGYCKRHRDIAVRHQTARSAHKEGWRREWPE